MSWLLSSSVAVPAETSDFRGSGTLVFNNESRHSRMVMTCTDIFAEA